MLMTAGLGTRLRPFTEMEPKPLLPVLGVPMAQFAVDTLLAAGVRNIVANLHHKPEIARAGLQALDLEGASLRFSDESREILGSAGGIRQALPLLGSEAFFILNADVLCDVDLAALARAHLRLRQRHGVKMTLTLFPCGPAPGKYAELVVDPATSLISEWRPPVEGRPFYVGAGIVEPEAFAHLPEGRPSEFVPEVLKPLIASGQAGAFPSSGIWHDIGDPMLWWKTHLALINRLETGGLPARWKKRIEGANRRIAPRIWVSRAVSTFAPRAEWAGPAYLSPLANRAEGFRAPRTLGPRAVVYGSAPEGFAEGISYAEVSAGFSK